jgi:16S rRNA (uracil1498-N3)-methyltransferase
MPRIFADATLLHGDEVTLTGESHHYVTRVLRLAAGDEVVLFDGRGQEVRATIARAGSQGVTLTLGARTHTVIAATPPVTLLQGLPRGDRMDLIVQKASELGAARVVPVRTARTARGQQGRPDRWARIALEAARQCGRAVTLELSEVLTLEQALQALPGSDPGDRMVPWEEAPDAPSLERLISAAPRSVTVLIGPEGGLTRQEAILAMDAGFRVATLGPRILRTETAAIAVLAIIQARIGGMGS